MHQWQLRTRVPWADGLQVQDNKLKTRVLELAIT